MHRVRTAGMTGDQRQYNEVARELPQHTRVAVLELLEEPPGWLEVGHGVFPGASDVLKLRYPPTWKSWRCGAYWHAGLWPLHTCTPVHLHA